MTSIRAIFSEVLPFDALWRSVASIRAAAAEADLSEDDVQILLSPGRLGERDREVAASFAAHGVRVLDSDQGESGADATAGRRRAVESGVADVNWFLDPGVELATDSLTRLLELLRIEPWVGVLDATLKLDPAGTLWLDVPTDPGGPSRSAEAGGHEAAAIVDRLHRFQAPGPFEITTAAGHALAMTQGALATIGPPPVHPGDHYRGFLARAKEFGIIAVRSPDCTAVVNPTLPSPPATPAPDDAAEDANTNSGASASAGAGAAPDKGAILAGPGARIEAPPGTPRAVVEFSPSPTFATSALGWCPKDGIDLGSDAYRRAEPGRYALRYLDPEDGRELDRFVVDVPPERVAPSEITIGPYRAGDEYAILALWSKVFGKERELAMWRWLFTDNPAGMHVMLGRARDGFRIVSQFAGMQLRVQIRGTSHFFAQMVDSMSDPDCRQTLSRSGVFTDTVLEYVRTWGKAGEETFGFGLPNRLAYRIGKRTQGYTDIFPLDWRVRDVADLEAREAPKSDIRVVASDTILDGVSDLWDRIAPGIPMCTIRDPRYLHWRYLRHPERTYRFFHAVDTADRVVGFAVGAPGFIEQPWYAIGDWMLEPGAVEAGRLLVGACEDAARETGSARILGSVLPVDSEADRIFESLGYPRETSQWKWVGRIYDEEALDWDYVRSNFYLTLGDSDLF